MWCQKVSIIVEEQQMFINFKKPNNVSDITNICRGFPSVFEGVKNYDKTESWRGCYCENIITPPMSITYMGITLLG